MPALRRCSTGGAGRSSLLHPSMQIQWWLMADSVDNGDASDPKRSAMSERMKKFYADPAFAARHMDGIVERLRERHPRVCAYCTALHSQARPVDEFVGDGESYYACRDERVCGT